MTLQRYSVFAIILFLIGVFTLFSGFNRAPFRQTPNQEHPAQHSQALPEQTQTAAAICSPVRQ